jgi:hypothetical protein
MAAEALVGRGDVADHLQQEMPPELVSPVGLFPAHETSPANGVILDAGGSRVGAHVVGSTLGILDRDFTPDTSNSPTATA